VCCNLVKICNTEVPRVARWLRAFFQGKKYKMTESKTKLVIVGSGWAGYELIRAVDRSKYEVILISPR